MHCHPYTTQPTTARTPNVGQRWLRAQGGPHGEASNRACTNVPKPSSKGAQTTPPYAVFHGT